MRILLTGGGGFVGHHMIQKLLSEQDIEVVSLDRSFSKRIKELRESLSQEQNQRLTVVIWDITSPIPSEVVNEIGKIDYVIHCAANADVAESIKNPTSSLMSNVVGTFNILEYTRLHVPNIIKFINIGTNEIFGQCPEGIDFSEYDRYNSRTPYSASKAAAEEFCVAYENTYKLPISCIHTMNVFGERQSPNKFINIVMRKILNGENITINPGTRKWIHATDLCDAIWFVLNLNKVEIPSKEHTCPKFNIVGEEYSNLEIATMVADVLGKPLNCEAPTEVRAGHDFRYSLNGEYINSLGWKITTPFDVRIKNMVNWTLQNNRWL